jgi:hypothetical protein
MWWANRRILLDHYSSCLPRGKRSRKVKKMVAAIDSVAVLSARDIPFDRVRRTTEDGRDISRDIENPPAAELE